MQPNVPLRLKERPNKKNNVKKSQTGGNITGLATFQIMEQPNKKNLHKEKSNWIYISKLKHKEKSNWEIYIDSVGSI